MTRSAVEQRAELSLCGEVDPDTRFRDILLFWQVEGIDFQIVSPVFNLDFLQFFR